MRSTSMASMPMATITTADLTTCRSTRRARRARRRVARRCLAGRQRLAALDPEVAFGDAVVDEVPRQAFGLAIRAMDVLVGVGKVAQAVALPGADRAPPVAAVGVHGLNEPCDAAVAARENGLEIRLPRRLHV